MLEQDAVRVTIALLPLALALGSPPTAAGALRARGDAAITDATRGALFDQLVERERSVALAHDARLLSRFAPVPRPAAAPGGAPALDCVHAAHDITVDPETGVTSATLELRVRANGRAVGAIGLAIDKGLHADDATMKGHDLTVSDATFAGTRVVRLDLEPALAPGEEATLRFPYSGTLACEGAEGSARVCSKSGAFAYFAQQSIFPLVFDSDAPDDARFDGLTREITLRVPAGDDVVVTGQRASESADAGTKVSRWTVDRPLSRSVGLYALVGRLGRRPVEGRSVPTTFFFPSPARDIDDELVDWSRPALEFIEHASGARLPFERNLSLVRLPQALGDPGTATFGMTLLSDSYAKTGDLMYEETWAHENAHLFWGIVVPETDANESRLMTEGMATLLQLEYSHDRHFPSEDRDAYLARRLGNMGLDLRVTGKDLPPVVVQSRGQIPAESRARTYTMWAYYRTAITLDHLRVTAGEDAFARALALYKERCSYVGCRPDALRVALEDVTGKAFSPFFDRWVTGRERPPVRIGFTPAPGAADVELDKDDDRPMTLELWLTLDDGSRVKRRVDLGGRTTRQRLEVEPARRIVAVAASPRHDALVDVRSAVPGDLDFDGETDGFDVLRCARLVGSEYDPTPASGLWNARASFDQRCDVDEDHVIDDRDLDELARTFGALRPR